MNDPNTKRDPRGKRYDVFGRTPEFYHVPWELLEDYDRFMAYAIKSKTITDDLSTLAMEDPAGFVAHFSKDPLRVIIAMPKRHYRGLEDLPPAVARALKELRYRGVDQKVVPNDDDLMEWETCQTDNPEADAAFHTQAKRYTFEFIAVVGGLSRARNTAIGEAIKSEAVFVIWQDDDLLAADGYGGLAEIWLRLLSHRQPCVGALYCTRKRRPTWACSFMPAAGAPQPNADGLLQVAELATGLCCFHVKVVYGEIARIFGGSKDTQEPGIKYRDRDTGETLFGFYQNVVVDGDLLSEDYFLNYLMRCARIPILADTKILARHVDADGSVYPEGDFPPLASLEDAPTPPAAGLIPPTPAPKPADVRLAEMADEASLAEKNNAETKRDTLQEENDAKERKP